MRLATMASPFPLPPQDDPPRALSVRYGFRRKSNESGIVNGLLAMGAEVPDLVPFSLKKPFNGLFVTVPPHGRFQG